VRVSLSKINSSFEGFEKLILLYRQARVCRDDSYEIDMSRVTWFDANMCAPLGAILYQYPRKYKIKLSGLRPSLEKLLQRNGFLPNFGFNREKVFDHLGTTIEYQRFEGSDSTAFKDYVSRHFVGKGIPNMSQVLHKKFRESIAELFENAIDHSFTQKGIFACGQYFPNASRLDFSIVDLGIGIKENVKQKLGLNLEPDAAISWAVSGENTTRQMKDGKPGGLGLKLIKEFIKLNHGKIQIASDAGYWDYDTSGESTRKFSMPFPGTTVNIEINTSDNNSYCLSSELNPEDIF